MLAIILWHRAHSVPIERRGRVALSKLVHAESHCGVGFLNRRDLTRVPGGVAVHRGVPQVINTSIAVRVLVPPPNIGHTGRETHIYLYMDPLMCHRYWYGNTGSCN